MNNSNNRFLQSNLQSNDLATETTLKDIDQVLRNGVIDISGNVSVTGTSDFNLTQVNSENVDIGNGIADSGTQRVTISSDNSQIAVSINAVADTNPLNINIQQVDDNPVNTTNSNLIVHVDGNQEDIPIKNGTGGDIFVSLNDIVTAEILNVAVTSITSTNTQKVRIMDDVYSTRRQRLQIAGSENLGQNITVQTDTSFNNSEFDNIIIDRVTLSIRDDAIEDQEDWGGGTALANGYRLFYKVSSGDSKRYLTGAIVDNGGHFDNFELAEFRRSVGSGTQDVTRAIENFNSPIYIDSNSGGTIGLDILGASDMSLVDSFFVTIAYRGYADF